MKWAVTALLALGLSAVASSGAFAQNDSCGTPTKTQAWTDALAQHGPFASNDETIKFTVAFIYKHCSGGDLVELPQTVIALCNFNKSIVRMDADDIACILVPQSD
ncbi:MAG TPA: hypothetical protein VMF62_08290 [Acetobacteraceae bacterium]|jgi:hypothetical protein|nr:hypothetical protein [Acetobacteraceae bacterium]